jgi:hypothetical protein
MFLIWLTVHLTHDNKRFQKYSDQFTGTIVQYCVLACMIALERHELRTTLQKQGATVQALRCQFPELRKFVEALHECRYADFMKSLAWVRKRIFFCQPFL